MIDAPKLPRPMRSKVAGWKARLLRWLRGERLFVRNSRSSPQSQSAYANHPTGDRDSAAATEAAALCIPRAIPLAAEHACGETGGAIRTTTAGTRKAEEAAKRGAEPAAVSSSPEWQSWLPHVLFLALLAVLVERIMALQAAIAASR